MILKPEATYRLVAVYDDNSRNLVGAGLTESEANRLYWETVVGPDAVIVIEREPPDEGD
jgi:hypothetical protein